METNGLRDNLYVDALLQSPLADSSTFFNDFSVSSFFCSLLLTAPTCHKKPGLSTRVEIRIVFSPNDWSKLADHSQST